MHMHKTGQKPPFAMRRCPSPPPGASCCSRLKCDNSLKYRSARREQTCRTQAVKAVWSDLTAITPSVPIVHPDSGLPPPRELTPRTDCPMDGTLDTPTNQNATTNDHTPVRITATGSPPGGQNPTEARRSRSAWPGDITSPKPRAGTTCFAHGNSLSV